MQRIISWNVASVRARLPKLLELLEAHKPDIVFLQEIKATDENFPFAPLQEAGYHALISGQKSYNGVAILSKEPLELCHTSIPDFPDEQARFIEALMPNGTHLICVYVPNGNPVDNPAKFDYKLQWMDGLNKYLYHLLMHQEPVIIGGDFNVIEENTDVYNPNAFQDNAIMVPPVRERFEQLKKMTLINVLKQTCKARPLYSFWDFTMNAWHKNWGMLLDYFFISPDLESHVNGCGIYTDVRGWEKTSDHAPLWLEMK